MRLTRYSRAIRYRGDWIFKSSRRLGYVLVAVLMVIVVLSLIAYRFTDAMTTEYRGSVRTGDMAKVRAAAISGIHFAMASLADQATFQQTLGGNSPMTSPSIFNNQSYFGDVVVYTDPNNPDKNVMFSIVSVTPSASGQGTYLQKYGVIDEGSKININALAAIDPTGNTLYNVLLQLPNMMTNPQTAANIVAYVLPSTAAPLSNNAPVGVQSNYYEGLPYGYYAHNGPLNTLDELLLVDGVTPQLLYGNDQNLNGLGDDYNTPGQSSGASPMGGVDRGWQDYLTVNGRELNVNSEGSMRINVNASTLSAVNSALQNSTVAQEMQTYILGARLYGTTPVPATTTTTKARSSTSSNTGGRLQPGNIPVRTVASLPSYQKMLLRVGFLSLDRLTLLTRDAEMFTAFGLPQGKGGGGGTGGGQGGTGGGQGGTGGGQGGTGTGQGGTGGTQGGTGGKTGNTGGKGGNTGGKGGGAKGGATGGGSSMPTTTQGTISDLQSAVQTALGNGTSASGKISSIPGLANTQVSFANPNGQKGSTIVVASPLTTATLSQYLPSLMDQLTTSSTVELNPRINMSTAPQQVISALLLALPNSTTPMFTQSDVENLIAAQSTLTPGDPAMSSGAWMATTGQLSLTKYQALLNYTTGTSSLYRVQAVGYYAGSETYSSNGTNASNWPMARVEALIDTNLGFPRIVYIRDLTALDTPRGFNLPLQTTGQ